MSARVALHHALWGHEEGRSVRLQFCSCGGSSSGSPLSGLAARDGDLARHLAGAIRDAVRGLVDVTLEREADFLVISGDVYDGEWKDHSVGLFFNREMARLDRAGIPVFVIKGNHDAHSVVTRSITLPTT